MSASSTSASEIMQQHRGPFGLVPFVVEGGYECNVDLFLTRMRDSILFFFDNSWVGVRITTRCAILCVCAVDVSVQSTQATGRGDF